MYQSSYILARRSGEFLRDLSPSALCEARDHGAVHRRKLRLYPQLRLGTLEDLSHQPITVRTLANSGQNSTAGSVSETKRKLQ